MPARRQPGTSRAAILAAAYDLIGTLGYASATTAEICRRAGVSSGTFFHHFPTKEEVLLALLADPVIAPPRESVEGVVTATLDELEDPRLASFVREVSRLVHLPRVEEALARLALDRRDRIRGAVRRGQQEGSVRSDRSEEQLTLRVELLLDGAETLVATDPGLDRGELRSEVLAVLADAVAPANR